MNKKTWIVIFLLCLCESAFAVTNLKDLRVGKDGYVHLSFDKKLSESQIKIDTLRDIVQFSIKNATVYPAKIFSVDQKSLKKVFAYQYTPNVIRCRLTVPGDSNDFKNNFSLSKDRKTLTLKVSTIVKKDEKPKTQSIQVSQSKASNVQEASTSEKELLKKLIENENEKPLFSDKSSNERTNKKSSDGFFDGFSFIGFLFLLFIFGSFLFRRKMLGSSSKEEKKSFFSGLFKKMKNGGFAGSDNIKLIEKVFIEQKKAISIIEIYGKKYAIGITDENLSLIGIIEDDANTLLNEDDEFNSLLNEEFSRPTISSPVVKNEMASNQISPNLDTQSSVRERIKKRLEGLKEI